MKTTNDRLFSVRSMVFTAIFAALICIAAPFALPMPGSLVPVSLGTFAIYLTGAMLGGKRGALAVAVYIALGTAGLPVFTGFMGGLGKVLGPTGGYIVGYIPLVLLTGIFSDMSGGGKRHWLTPVGMVLGTAVMYAFGTAWYMIMNSVALVPALLSCVVPFLVGDTLKIVAATAISVPLRARLNAVMGGSDK